MSQKYCTKKGHHEGRLIEAICLRPECKDDRLLCFYCKHQSHRYHETAYFPKGLPASLQTFNKNSSIENSHKQRNKIDRKILSIQRGWQSVQKTMFEHVRSIQSQINESYQTIENTFSATSVLKIKQKLSTEEMPPQDVERYVRMINHVNQFELNNPKKVMVYTKLKQRMLEDVFMKAAQEMNGIIQQISENAKLLNFNSDELEKYVEKYFDEQNGSLRDLSDQKLFIDYDSNEEFQKRFQSQFDETESDVSSLESKKSEEESIVEPVPEINHQKQALDNESPEKSVIIVKDQHIQITGSPLYSPKNFTIRIGKVLTQGSLTQSHEYADEYDIDQDTIHNESCGPGKSNHKQFDRLQYRNIIKLKNQAAQSDRFELQSFEQNAILCCRKVSFSKQEQEEESIFSLNKTKKKVKPNEQNLIEQMVDQRMAYKQKIDKMFAEFLDEESSSNSQSEKVQTKKTKKEPKSKPQKTQAVYCSFDFSAPTKPAEPILKKKEKPSSNTSSAQQTTHNHHSLDQNAKQEQAQEHPTPQEGYIEIQRKIIKLPSNSHPSAGHAHTHLYYPHVKVYGHTLDDIYESLELIDTQVITKLEIYCDTTTLCVDTECVELICKMKKLKSLMVYMTYQMDRRDVKRLVKNLPLLEELVLSEFNKMDGELAKLIRARLPKLRRFFYTVDYRNYMQKIEENLEFFIDFNMPSTSLEVIDVLADIPSLETIEIINVNNKVANKIPHLLKKMTNLKEVCITNTNNPKSNSAQIVAFLASSPIKLEVFCAHNTMFREESLVKIVENNKSLRTLIINECLQLHNETMKVISDNCPNLQQLSLMLIDSINGREICTFTRLKTLVLRGCWQIDQDHFFNNIHKLSQLQFLSVSLNNYWFYDPLMKEVVKLSKLKFLNLDTTKVSDDGIKDLHKLEQLETLICGKTEVTFQQLIKALKGPQAGAKNLTIRKLGLSKDESYSRQIKSKPSKNKHDLSITQFHAKHLLALGRALPKLTHLSIGGFINPKKEYFETLTNLKCLFVTKKQLASETENWLVSKGVNINQDY